MQLLASKTYSAVDVWIRGEKDPFRMPVDTGLKLMDALTSGNAGTHIQLTDQDGHVVVKLKTEIVTVSPQQKIPDVKDYV